MATDLIQHYFVEDISAHFTFHGVLGKGAFGYVSRATSVASGKAWAVKVVELKNSVDRVRSDLGVLSNP